MAERERKQEDFNAAVEKVFSNLSFETQKVTENSKVY
jgi:hypothetical protein